MCSANSSPDRSQFLSRSRLVCLTDNESLAAEKFRFLGITLATSAAGPAAQESADYQHNSPRGQKHGFCQPGLLPRSKNTAEDLADGGRCAAAALSQMFGLERIPGICECLQGERDLMTSIYHLEGPGLWFLPAGSAPKNPLELLQSGSCPH